MTDKKCKNVKIEKVADSEVEITIEAEESFLPNYWKDALKKFSKEITLPGFRKGQVPEKMVIERLGEDVIWEEASERFVKDAYPEVVYENKIKAIGRPEVEILKSVPRTELSVKIKTAVFPELKLADYEDIAKKKPTVKESETKVTDEEVEKVIEVLRSERKSNDGKLPEVNLDFIKSLGDFESVEDFKEKVKANLEQEKTFKKRSERRISLIDDIIEKSTIEMPRILVESELDRMIAEFQGEIEGAGLQFDDYLVKSKMTVEKLREEWSPRAEKRAKMQLILNQIAEEQKIRPDENLVNQEVERIMGEYSSADKERTTIFVETVLTNDAVFGYLENLHEKSSK